MAMAFQTSVSTNPALGYPGSLDVESNHDIVSARNDDTVSMAFGRGIVWKVAAPLTDISAVLPVNQTDPVLGIVIFSQRYARAWTDFSGYVHGDLDATGLVPGTMMSVLRQGRILVTAGSNVTAGVSKLYVRRTAAANPIGSLEGAAVAAEMIDCSAQGTWMSTATAGNLAWLSVNFR